MKLTQIVINISVFYLQFIIQKNIYVFDPMKSEDQEMLVGEELKVNVM